MRLKAKSYSMRPRVSRRVAPNLNDSTCLSVGIVGYGDFAKLLCEQLAPYVDSIIVYSRSGETGEAVYGAQFAPLDDVLQADVIIPSFPSQFFDDFFAEHGAAVRTDALVVDVCSVKLKPLAALERHLPRSVQIVGTHPLFGPASIRKNGGVTGLRLTLCRARSTEVNYQKLKAFLSKTLQLHVIEKTPDEHDRDMAYVQGLSHYIGRVMDEMDIPKTELATFAYEDLLDMRSIQGGDSWNLFQSIMHDNPHTAAVHQQFLAACQALDEKLNDS